MDLIQIIENPHTQKRKNWHNNTKNDSSHSRQFTQGKDAAGQHTQKKHTEPFGTSTPPNVGAASSSLPITKYTSSEIAL